MSNCRIPYSSTEYGWTLSASAVLLLQLQIWMWLHNRHTQCMEMRKTCLLTLGRLSQTVMQYYEHAYETHAYLPIYFTVTLSMYTLIPTVYRALLKSAVSGTDHRIHTTKKTVMLSGGDSLFVRQFQALRLHVLSDSLILGVGEVKKWFKRLN